MLAAGHAEGYMCARFKQLYARASRRMQHERVIR